VFRLCSPKQRDLITPSGGHISMKTFLLGALTAAAVGLATLPAKAETFVTVLTGGTTGVYYPLGVALSKIYADNIPDVRQRGKPEPDPAWPWRSWSGPG
jgi:hypothetical protein